MIETLFIRRIFIHIKQYCICIYPLNPKLEGLVHPHHETLFILFLIFSPTIQGEEIELTMKFQALTLVAALVQAVSATKSLSGDEFNSMLRSGKIDTKTLLKSSVPYRKDALRNLAENEGQNGVQDAYGVLGQTGITGDYSVSFNSCVSLTVEEEWANVENYESLATYIQREQIQSVRNYVLFNVCETMGDCSDPSVSETNTYMVDLNTWVSAMIGYLPSQKEEYCTGCENQAEYCENYYQYKADGIDYNKAAFFYDDIKFQLIDCEQCAAYGCNDEDGDQYEQNGWDYVEAWVSSLAQCQATESTFNDVAEYAGFMCNSDGSGLEIAVFMDEDCSLYNSMRSYRSTLADGDENWAYYGKSQSVISYLFNYQFDCYGGDLIYVNLFQQVYMDQSGWSYDPCQYDQSSQTYMDEYGCQNMMYNNPCYGSYNENGEMEVNDEEECQEFMEENPCWTMPGTDVSEDYQEACYEYLAEYSHQANYACSSLFGSYDGDNGDGGNSNEANEEMAFPATSLGSCAYYYQANYNGQNDEAEAEAGEDAAEDEEGNDYSWSTYLTYDITSDMMEEEFSICYQVDKMFLDGEHVEATVYDSTKSGEMYSYDTEDSNSSDSVNDVGYSGNKNYFPTMPNMPTSVAKAARKSTKMSAGAIFGISLFVVGVAFLGFIAVNKVRDTIEDMVDDDEDTVKDKELPLMT